MVKMRKIELEIITDSDMYTFSEKGTRGRISYISNKYRKKTINIWNLMTQNNNQNISYT